jgi:hypothetical protein
MPSLWSDAIRSDILSPYKILEIQAADLKLRTKGLLVGEVRQREAGEKRVALSLDIVVPLFNGSRYRILTIGHGKDEPYPAVLDDEVIRVGKSKSSNRPHLSMPTPRPRQLPKALIDSIPPTSLEELQATAQFGKQIESEEQLNEELARVLGSRYVVSLLQSLIARANDVLATKEGQNIASDDIHDDPAGENPAESS